jgi:hypothetical protein
MQNTLVQKRVIYLSRLQYSFASDIHLPVSPSFSAQNLISLNSGAVKIQISPTSCSLRINQNSLTFLLGAHKTEELSLHKIKFPSCAPPGDAKRVIRGCWLAGLHALPSQFARAGRRRHRL